MKHLKSRAFTSMARSLSASLILALVFSAFLAAPVLAADCVDGNNSDNVLTCDSDTGLLNTWEGGGGDDTMTQGANSNIDWNVSGGLGDDNITLNGQVGENLLGHSVYGDGVLSGGFTNGGDDQIIINGTTSGDVMGDGILNFLGGNGGDDTIIINGTVGGNVVGDGIASLLGGSGGNDIIVINGTVLGDVLADGVASIFGNGGDDEVAVAEGATILGIIDGGKGTDKLTLFGVYQDELDLLDPQGGSVTSGSKTYTWINFEFLIGKIREVVSELVESDNGRRIIYLSGSLLGVDHENGIKIFSENGLVAFVPYAEIASMNTGDSLTYQAAIANSGGWYVVVTDLGVNPNNAGNHLYQFDIYDAAGVFQGRFTIAN